LGKKTHSKDEIEGIKWSENPIKAMSVYFGLTIKKSVKIKLGK